MILIEIALLLEKNTVLNVLQFDRDGCAIGGKNCSESVSVE